MERKYFKGYDGENIPYLYFESSRKDNNNNIVIFHGMTEPIDRYVEFGQFLATNGYNVFIPEIRGHGELKKAEIEGLGERGINGVFRDIEIFFDGLYQKDINKNNTIIFGHSFGSLIATRLMIEMKYRKLILLGMTLQTKAKSTLGWIGSYLERVLFLKKASLFNRIFEKYNSTFEPVKTGADWLTRDEEETRKFIEDENCGYLVTPDFFTGIFKTMRFINRNYRKIQKGSRILAVYGTEDRAVNIAYLNKIFKKLKKKKIKINILANQNGRHESLNEINKYKIYDEILRWMNENKN